MPTPTGKSRSGPRDTSGPDHLERVSLVCHHFIRGVKPADIPAILLKQHKIKISRETSYRYLTYAAQRGWLKFSAPTAQYLRDRLRASHGWLVDPEVVHTGHFEDVARHAGDRLLKLIMRHAINSRGEVHVGFSGGYSMRAVAERLAELLRKSRKGLPDTIVFHAMVAGFDVHDPTTDPNTFITYFQNDPDMKVNTRVIGLHAPPIVHNDTLESLKELEGITNAFAAADQLDIIATSVGNWSLPCKDGMLLKYMARCGQSIKILDAAGCCGDMLWRPFGKRGPITDETPLRAMTLIELSDVAQFIHGGKSVLVVLGPCRICHEPRGEVLATLLGLEEHLLTDLVVDSRSVKAMLDRTPGADQ